MKQKLHIRPIQNEIDLSENIDIKYRKNKNITKYNNSNVNELKLQVISNPKCGISHVKLFKEINILFYKFFQNPNNQKNLMINNRKILFDDETK